MQKAASDLLNLNQFKTFCKTGSDVYTYDCDIYKANWIKRDGLWIFEIMANRFLYGMVRSIVGLLVHLGKGNISYTKYLEIIQSQDRTKIELTAPAHGLVLEKIGY